MIVKINYYLRYRLKFKIIYNMKYDKVLLSNG
jgi:hypothetical protein